MDQNQENKAEEKLTIPNIKVEVNPASTNIHQNNQFQFYGDILYSNYGNSAEGQSKCLQSLLKIPF